MVQDAGSGRQTVCTQRLQGITRQSRSIHRNAANRERRPYIGRHPELGHAASQGMPGGLQGHYSRHMIQQMANQSRRPNVANVTGIQLENIRQYVGNQDTPMSRIRPPEGNINVIARALDVGIKPMAHMDMPTNGIVPGCTAKRREGMIQGGQWNAWQKGCVRMRRHSHQIPSGSRIKVGIPGKSDPSGNAGRIMRIVPVMEAATYHRRHNAGQYLD
ncbi:hypothetical protein [Akkermansia sp. CAG:344]|uniref:hypothetical protein n=2 Tax=Akkermansia TaxID=239934 RepID=UPI0025C39677|nr:hypothetical protein [Akkermansia sp. CAG:344]